MVNKGPMPKGGTTVKAMKTPISNKGPMPAGGTKPSAMLQKEEEDIMIDICDYLIENDFAEDPESVYNMYLHMSDEWKSMVLDELGKD